MKLFRNKKFIVFALLSALLFMNVGFSEQVYADGPKLPYDVDESKLANQDISARTGSSAAVGTLVNTMYSFANYLSALIFGVAVIMIVYAGFKYATSGGDEKVTEVAKKQIIYAGVGIGVALLAMIIVRLFADIFNVV